MASDVHPARLQSPPIHAERAGHHCGDWRRSWSRSARTGSVRNGPARSSANSLAALYEPYPNAPAITAFQGSGNTFTISTAAFTDELSLEPGGFTLLRKTGGRLLRLVEAANHHPELLDLTWPAAVEVDWSEDGKTVEINMPHAAGGTLRIRAPEAESMRLNGRQIESRRDGEFRIVSLPVMM